MELGGLRWIPLVPEFGDNRDLPPGEQLSLEIERMRTAEVMSGGGDERGSATWLASESMKRWMDSDEYGPAIRRFDAGTLAVFRQFVERTRGFRGFVFDGQELADPVEIFLRAPTELTSEITIAINAAARLSGHALGNFVLRCGGSRSETAVPGAQNGDDPTSVSIPEAVTAS